MNELLAGLNERQAEAVTTTEGPLLILAGPGSGKTRVITHRIAYLIAERGVRPWRVLAVTFTNKAAREMRERVEALLGDAARSITLGTFHSVCARILRTDGAAVGLERNFAIYDDGDQLSVIKRAFDSLSIDAKRTNPRAVLSAISKAKNDLLDPDEYQRGAQQYFEEIVARVYMRYQQALAAENAVDFDDLLLKTVELLSNAAPVLEKYQQRFQHVLVDEFQDTNVVQYILARDVGRGHGNICVVGDPDQSIYRWRSADVRNLAHFEQDFPGTKVILLEQNYRSTQNILDAAHGVISAAESRRDKGLWTENERGLPVTIYEAGDGDDEAAYVVREISSGLRGGRRPRDFAVLYRTNAQSRPLEDALVRGGIRYRLVGGTRFYERREVKDALAYLRLINNPRDSISLARAINTPPRGIGAGTLSELNGWALELGVPPYYALQLLLDYEENGEQAAAAKPPFSSRTSRVLIRFVRMLDELIDISQQEPVGELLRELLERIDYQHYLLQGGEGGEERWQNVEELVNLAAKYDESAEEIAGERTATLEAEGEEDEEGRPNDELARSALAAFLEDVALVSDVDELDQQQDAVTLITLHTAKGLEFPVVFMVGMEEGLLPHSRSIDDPAQLEEERRICYVGITRARERLHLSYAVRRSNWGASMFNDVSRYLADIPKETVAQRARGGVSSGLNGPVRTRSLRDSILAHAMAEAEPAAPLPGAQLAVGNTVRHASFGEGIVLEATPRDGDLELKVIFKGTTGTKKLMQSFAKLEKISP